MKLYKLRGTTRYFRSQEQTLCRPLTVPLRRYLLFCSASQLRRELQTLRNPSLLTAHGKPSLLARKCSTLLHQRIYQHIITPFAKKCKCFKKINRLEIQGGNKFSLFCRKAGCYRYPFWALLWERRKRSVRAFCPCRGFCGGCRFFSEDAYRRPQGK